MAEAAGEPLRCAACAAAVEWRWCCAGTVPRERPGRPRNDETMWGDAPVDLGDGRTLRSDIWPKVLYSENLFHFYRPQLTCRITSTALTLHACSCMRGRSGGMCDGACVARVPKPVLRALFTLRQLLKTDFV